MKQVSINRIFTKIKRDLGRSELPEQDVIEWAGEALEAIGAVPAYEQAVVFLEVSNYQASLPSNIHMIIQVAKNNLWSEEDKKCFCPNDITDMPGQCTVTVSTEEGESETVDPCECEDWGLDEYVPNFAAAYEFGVWTGSNLYRSTYSPVRLAEHSFMGTLVCEQDPQLYDNVFDEYTIVNGDTLRFSFETGSVAVAYYRQPLDEDGYPKIPDHYSYVTAVTKYITMMLMQVDFYSGRQGAQARYQKAEQDWLIYCNQAGNHALMIKGVDEHQNWLDQTQHFIPKLKRYYGFFGKLAHPEYRKYNKANRIGYRNRYYEV